MPDQPTLFDLFDHTCRLAEADEDHETAKAELKKLVPEDAKVPPHRTRHPGQAETKAGAISFDPLQTESANAPVK